MALVVLLKGVNVGGHRRFRPTSLVEELGHLDAVNIGAAGTFVIRKRLSPTNLRQEIAGWLPFDAEIMICEGQEIVDLAKGDFFRGHPQRPDVVRFVSVLSQLPDAFPPVPIDLSDQGNWMVKVLAREGQFVVGVYRRRMKAITYLDKLEQLFGVPITTRSWNTVVRIVNVVGLSGPGR